MKSEAQSDVFHIMINILMKLSIVTGIGKIITDSLMGIETLVRTNIRIFKERDGAYRMMVTLV